MKHCKDRWRRCILDCCVKLLGLAFLFANLGFLATAEDTRVIRGNDLIPINPDFSVDPSLRDPATGNEIIASGGTLGKVFQQGISAPVRLQQQLAASLTQAIGAANRPSVLTPYSGQLAGTETEDTFGSIVTNKATTLGRGKI